MRKVLFFIFISFCQHAYGQNESFVQFRYFILGNLKSTNEQQSWIPIQLLYGLNKRFRIGVNYNAFNMTEASLLHEVLLVEKTSSTRAYSTGLQTEFHFFDFWNSSIYLGVSMMGRVGEERINYEVSESFGQCKKDLHIKSRYGYSSGKIGFEKRIYKHFSFNVAIPLAHKILYRNVDISQNIDTCQDQTLAEPLDRIDNFKFGDFFPLFDTSIGLIF